MEQIIDDFRLKIEVFRLKMLNSFRQESKTIESTVSTELMMIYLHIEFEISEILNDRFG